MPHLSQTGLTFGYMAGSLGSVPSPGDFIIPQDALIAYYGSDPGLTDWTRYSVADGYYIRATTTQGTIGTVTARVEGGMSSIAIPSVIGGQTHTGSQTPTWLQQNITSFGVYRNEWSSIGDHVHTISPTSVLSTGLYPPTANVTLLRANKNTGILPTNSLIFSQSMPNDNAIPMTSNAYLKGVASNAGTVNVGVTSVSAVATISTSGAHTHLTSTSQQHPTSLQSTGAIITIATTQNPAAGAHTHPTTLVFTQTGITSRLLKLWKLAVNSSPTTDIILMYVGDLSLLPQNWYICDGTNGTTRIDSLIIGYSDQTGTWNITTSPTITATATTSTLSDTHTHLSPTVTGRYLPYGSGASTDYHNTFIWSHSHSISSTTSSYQPESINVAFIQYKGNPIYTPTSPINTILPVITGTAIAGGVLTCSTGTWSSGSSGSPITYTYQWQHGTININGATSNTFILAFQQYVGETLRCVVTATNYAGSTIVYTLTTAPVATVVTGEIVYTSGSGTWLCPEGVTSVTILCVGAGGGANSHGGGGGGGALAYGNNITVVPGTYYSYAVGAGVAGGTGGDTTFNTTWIVAGGGKVGALGVNQTGGGGGGAAGYTDSGGYGGGCISGTLKAGGAGGTGSGTYRSGGGGGGAGGAGSSISSAVAAGLSGGGGGGGGGAGGFSVAFGGGGVGVYGQGAGGNGGAAVSAGSNGVYVANGGSGGTPAYAEYGGTYGGGAAGVGGGSAGGAGAIRIIWPGQFRSFPSTNVAIL